MRILRFLAGLSLVLMAGCRYQELNEMVGSEDAERVPETVSAAVEDIDAVRTTVNDSRAIVWSKGDEIAIFNDNVNPCRYRVDDSAAEETAATFSLAETAAQGMNTGINVAVYPYSSTLEYTAADGGCTIRNLNFPSVQTYAKSSFSSGSFPMAAVAKAGSDRYSFRNVGGVLKLNLTGAQAVRSITVKGNDGEVLSGTASVYLSEGKDPEVSMDGSEGNTVTLHCGTVGVRLDKEVPTVFMIALPPTGFEKGFSVTIEDIMGSYMAVKTIRPNAVGRSQILNMPVLEYSPDEEMVINIEALSESFKGVDVRVEAQGAVQFSGGCKLKESFTYDGVVREANWKLVPRIDGDFVYEGPMTGFNSDESATALPGRTYVLWVAAYAKDQTRVTSEDITIKEFTIPAVCPGGALGVDVEDVEVESKAVRMSLGSAKASMIYAALLTDAEMASLTTDAEKTAYLLDNTTPYTGSSAQLERSSLTADSSLALLALAVDEKGCYGPLKEEEYMTASYSFNEDLKVTLELEYEDKSARIKVSSTGGDVLRYYYYTGKTMDSSWKNTLGGSVSAAESFMLKNYDHFAISDTDNKPFTDGCIVMDNLALAVQYIVVVMAADADGRMSRAAYVKFTPEMDMGDFVGKSGDTAEKWNGTLPEISFGDCRGDGEFYVIEWSVVPADGTKAYALCTHPNEMSLYGNARNKAMHIYDKGVEVVPGKTEVELFGDAGYYLYVTWCDVEGNFYEPYSTSVPQSD